jgi:Homeodomain-like domain
MMKNNRPKPQEERNFSMVQLSNKGMSPADIGARFNVSPSRVFQIIARYRLSEKRRTQLKKRYRAHPKIGELPDNAPLDVLILCDANIHGWEARVRHFHHAVETLGELRRMSDQELLRLPHIGEKMFAQLRLFCPARSSRSQERKNPRSKACKVGSVEPGYALRACSDRSE